MDYFEEVLKALEESISIETDKMIEASKKIEELKQQRDVVLALSTKINTEY
jgi:hypothetical protein